MPEMMGVNPPRNVYAHIIGIDIVRVGEHYLRSRGQLPHPLGRLLYAGGPRGDDVSVSGAVRQASRRADRELSGHASEDADRGRARPRPTSRHWSCSPRASTTPPISSTPFLLTRWVSNFARAAISSSRTAGAICAPLNYPSGSTSSTVGSTMPFSIPSPSVPTHRSACPGCSTSTAPAASTW